jgi:excisionase family DNA binding protein
VTFEETLGAALDARLAAVHVELRQLHAAVQAVRRALPPPLVSELEAAKLIGVSLSTVRRRVKDGSLPVRRVGRRVLVDLGQMNAPEEAEIVRLADRCKADH